MARLPRLVAPLLLGTLPLLSLAPTLAACDTAGCEGGELLIEDLGEPGTGTEATASSRVTLHYVGMLEDGTVFDETDPDAPATFDLDGTIEGFSEGIAGMRVGGRRRITIPPELGYGEAGNGPVPSCATLIFEVELLGVA